MKKIKIIFGLGLASLLATPLLAQPRQLTLQECQDLALANNVKMKNARLEVEMAKADRQANIANFFPSIQATGIGFIADKGILGGELGDFINLPGSVGEALPGLASLQEFLMQNLPPELLPQVGEIINGITGPIDQGMQGIKHKEVDVLDKGLGAAVTAVQPVFMGMKIVNAQKLYKVGEQVKAYQLQQTHDEVLLTVEKYYRQLLNLREKEKTVISMDSLLNNLQGNVDEAVASGVKNRNDALQVNLKANQVKSGLIQVRNGISLTKMVLGQYIGVAVDSFDIVTMDEEMLSTPETYRTNHQAALEGNLNFRLLEKSVEATRLRKRLALGENLPNIMVGGGFAYHNFLNNIDRSFWFGTAAVHVPITKWWGGGLKMKKANLALQVAENTRDNAGELLTVQMQQLYNQLEEYYNQVEISKLSIETATENFRMQNDAYEAGTATMTELLNAESLLHQSRDQYANDYTNYVLKRMEYLHATGQYRQGEMVIDAQKGKILKEDKNVNKKDKEPKELTPAPLNEANEIPGGK
ncbi:MAG: TolC family protein [Bacteroides sp.]|nr:TolC family protein [Ruminococcus flavefaciens]MCM1554572.1 TolC family protein [Bacteroides sp.]